MERSLLEIQLEALAADSAPARKEIVEFVNRHYPSELPLEEKALTSGKLLLFWAKDRKTGARLGVSGYMPKTPFLAETVKTVIDPAHRGQGLGMRLSQAIEDEVRRRGFKKVMSTIYVTNLTMIFIKLKQGYYFEGFHPNHEKPGLHEYSFGKQL